MEEQQDKKKFQFKLQAIANFTQVTVSVYVQQTSGPAATVNGLIIKDSSGNIIASATGILMTAPIPTPSPNPSTLSTGTLTTITGTVGILAPGAYTVTVTTAAGGSFVSPSFTVP